jgi:hypothetical protein
MASRRALVSATTTDALQNELIKDVEVPSIINLFATAVTVTDNIGLNLDKTTIMASGTANVSAAAAGMVDVGRDQLIFNSVVGRGRLRMPVTVTTSLIYLLSVEPILG